MSSFSKVAWREGLFLQPHHFQQSDRYHERLLDLRIRSLLPYGWGLEEAVVARDRLLQGRVEFQRLTGIMPDGTPFDAPSVSPLPRPLEVAAEGAGQIVWLTLPGTPANTRDVADESEAGEATRYLLGLETVADTGSALRSEALVETALPRLELALRPGPRPGYQCLPLARVLEVQDRFVILDETFIPSLIVLRGHPGALAWLDRVIGWVEQRRDVLARYAADASAGGGLQDADYLLLMVLNREINVLRHLRQMPDVHPERLYEQFLRLSGELASFDNDRRLAPECRPYDHADLSGCIEPLVRSIQRVLSRDIGRATRLEIEALGHNAFLARVPDPNLFRDSTFVLEVEAARAPGLVQQQFPSLCKIAPASQMQNIVHNNLQGIELVHTPTPPRQIRALARNTYFLLDRSSPYWQEFSRSPAIGIHFAGDWPEMRLELWATLEGRT